MEADPPREGLEGSLPKCLRIAVLGNRRATWHDNGCMGQHVLGRFAAIVSPILRWGPNDTHPEIITPWGDFLEHEWFQYADDPAKADAMWEEAQERLRTGELE